MNQYVVQPGDTMGGIAAMFGLSLHELVAANPQIRNPNVIYPGQVINIPSAHHGPYGPPYAADPWSPEPYPPAPYPPGPYPPGPYPPGPYPPSPYPPAPPPPAPPPWPFGRYYEVQAGDTMAAIAAKHGIEPARLMKVNPQVKDPDRLVPGQKIMLP